MARLELNNDEMFEIAKSIIKPQKDLVTLYIDNRYARVQVAENSPTNKHRSVSNSMLMGDMKDELVQDAEELTEYFEDPEADGNLSRVEAQKALDELRDNVTMYFKEKYYHCNHDLIKVEHPEGSLRECEYCGYQPEDGDQE